MPVSSAMSLSTITITDTKAVKGSPEIVGEGLMERFLLAASS
jgi:hypothetical protein